MARKKPTEELSPVPNSLEAARSRYLLVGPQQLLNELLATELTRCTAGVWAVVENLEQLLPVGPGTSRGSPRRLVLWDTRDISPRQVSAEIGQCKVLDLTVDALALLNLRRGAADEQASVDLGVRGLFYAEDSLEKVRQGVETLLGDRVWIPPEAVSARPDPDRHRAGLPVPWSLVLTRRELEVLELLVSGRTNQEIAERLSISPHTAKTHLYRLYKKINVSSRLEAVIWYQTQVTR